MSETIEVTPANGWDKGTAVVTILTHIKTALSTPPLAVYFGDAANDIEGMAVVSHTGGVSVGIGPEAPLIAEQRLADLNELTACLNEMTAQLVSHAGMPLNNTSKLPGVSVESNITSADIHSENLNIRKPGLLLVDTDEEARTLFSNGMVKLGWVVWQADNAERAADLLKQLGVAIHVALVDLQLPGLQGARALTAFGQTRPDLVRCFLSSDVRPYMAAAFGKLSDVPLLVKPLCPSDADRMFRSLLCWKPPT